MVIEEIHNIADYNIISIQALFRLHKHADKHAFTFTHTHTGTQNTQIRTLPFLKKNNSNNNNNMKLIPKVSSINYKFD